MLRPSLVSLCTLTVLPRAPCSHRSLAKPKSTHDQMAMPEASPVSPHSAQVVGNVFVEQYYQVLLYSPAAVFRFYQESSFLSRPDSDGVMTTVTTMQAINEKILSFNYEDYKVEVETADAQDSYYEGVIVLVTGCLTGKDNVRKKFTQSFFLAPQDNGYYVLNDVFRFLDENEPPKINSVSANDTDENTPTASVTADPEPNVPDHIPLDPAISYEEDDLNNGAEVCDPSDNEEISVIEEEVIETQSNENETVIIIDSAPASQEDAPKRSYASIVKVPKGSAASIPIYVPTSTARVGPAYTNQESFNSRKPAPQRDAPAPVSNSALENDHVHEEAEGHSIYLRDLPPSVTVEQVEEVFKKFGSIKRNGVQVRSNKGFCFGFVEFESSSSMQSAIEASPVSVGDRQVVVEEKRTTTRVGSSGRGRYNTSGRGGFRNDNFRGRGNFGGGRSYGRNNEFRNQGEFSGWTRGGGSSSRGRESYQRVNQNGRGGGGRLGESMNRVSDSV